MRVTLVSEHASPLATLGGVDTGGQNVYVAALATTLGRRGIEVTVATRRDHPDVPRLVTLAPGVMVDHIDAGPARLVPKDELFAFMDDFATELRLRWSTARPNIVHAHFWMSGYAAIAAARPLDIPVVQTFHALGVVKRRHQGAKDTSPPERLAIERDVVRTADHIIATCSDETFELRRLGASAEQVTIVPCGVDVELFTPHGPTERRPPRRHRLVVVSRLVERKGIGNAITALAEVPDTELVVVGGPARGELHSDSEYRRLHALAEAHGVADRVEFRGRIERAKLPALLRSADAVICVPWYEPFGMVPLEAMACGVPVIATAVGGLIETVVDGVTGVHVPPQQPDKMAAAIRQLLADPKLRAELGAAGADRAHCRYTWERVAAATLDVYQSLAPNVGAVAAWRNR